VAVLIVSASLDPASIDRAAEVGADEIMDKFSSLDDVLGTIGRLGGAWEPPSAGSAHVPSGVRSDNTLKVRFSAMVGEEPEVEVALL
jgi:hypothetical protein